MSRPGPWLFLFRPSHFWDCRNLKGDVTPKGLFLPRGWPSRGLTGAVCGCLPSCPRGWSGNSSEAGWSWSQVCLALWESWAFLTEMRGCCFLPGLPWGSRKTKVAMPRPPVSPTPSSCVRGKTSAPERDKPMPRPGDTPLFPHSCVGPGWLGIDEPLELACGALTSAPCPSQTSPPSPSHGLLDTPAQDGPSSRDGPSPTHTLESGRNWVLGEGRVWAGSECSGRNTDAYCRAGWSFLTRVGHFTCDPHGILTPGPGSGPHLS